MTTLAAPAHSLTSPSHCVFLFIISASGIFGQTKGCSFTGCLLAATQSKIMPCFCTFSYLCQIFLLNCVSVVVFAIHAQSWRLTATFLDLGYPNIFSSINITFMIFNVKHWPYLHAWNLVEEKEKPGGSSDPMSFTLLRSGLWTKLGVNLSGKDYSHQTLRITWMHLPSYTEIVPKIFDPSCLPVFSGNFSSKICFWLFARWWVATGSAWDSTSYLWREI